MKQIKIKGQDETAAILQALLNDYMAAGGVVHVYPITGANQHVYYARKAIAKLLRYTMGR